MGKKNFYVVKAGYRTGIFDNWPECQAAVKGYKGAVFRGFETKKEALAWQNGRESVGRNDGEDVGENAGENVAANRVVVNELPFTDSSGYDGSDFSDYDYEVYTDGSYRDGKYSYGYAFVKAGEVIYEGKGSGQNSEAAVMRNVAGEIAAVVHAVQKAGSLNVKIRIYHDYAGIAFWVTGAWKANNKFTQAYVKFMNEQRGRYSFEKVAGHSGNRFNDYVDRLAKEALGISTPTK